MHLLELAITVAKRILLRAIAEAKEKKDKLFRWSKFFFEKEHRAFESSTIYCRAKLT